MQTSTNCIKMIESFEGCSLSSYQDEGGVWTIGTGHTGSDVCSGQTIIQEQADQFLAEDLIQPEKTIDILVKVSLSQTQFDALIDFIYNIGSGNFASSTLLSLLNQGQFDQVPIQLLRWNKVNGEPVDGLTRRRQAEGNLFTNGTYPES